MAAPAKLSLPIGALPSLPLSIRLLLTAFLAVIGFGYLTAIANIYHRHQMADGKPGLSLDDIRAVYRGLAVSASGEASSRMLTMIRGEMRQYLSSEADFTALETWLKAGAKPTDFDVGERRRTPRSVMIRNCLRCHAQSTGTKVSKEAPFSKDELDVDLNMVGEFTSQSDAAGKSSTTGVPEYTIPRLVLVSHQHMLTIPLFTLVIALLFALSRFPTRLKQLLIPIPMIALVFDFSGWWLARLSDLGVYFIVAAGAAFGLALGIQILVATVDLWRPLPSQAA